jgi:hypothetical protein
MEILYLYENGVLNFETGEFRDKRSNDVYVMKFYHPYIEFDINSPETRDFTKQLRSFFKDDEAYKYFQEIYRHSLK